MWKYLFLPLVAISPQKLSYFVSRTKYIYKKAIASFDFSPATAHIRHEKILNKQFLYDFWFIFYGSISKVPAFSKVHLEDGLFSWKITIPSLRDNSVKTNWNDYKFFSMTRKVLEIDEMVYNMTKNPKMYIRKFS